MAKVINAMPGAATAAAKTKTVKKASNAQAGVLKGLVLDMHREFTQLEEAVDAMGETYETVEGRINDLTMTAAAAKDVTAAMRDTIKLLKAADKAVYAADKALRKLDTVSKRGVHPDDAGKEADQSDDSEDDSEE